MWNMEGVEVADIPLISTEITDMKNSVVDRYAGADTDRVYLIKNTMLTEENMKMPMDESIWNITGAGNSYEEVLYMNKSDLLIGDYTLHEMGE